MMTRMSRTIASSILRKLSACASWRFLNWIWSSLLTPSTSSATTCPNIDAISAFAVGRVLDDVVQDRRHQRVGIELQVRQDVGHRDRMGDVGLARDALLALVALGAEFVGLADPLDLRGRQVGLELV